ncbi:hypothetical protein PHYPO_G00184270 [Pangasianodon hypophthalmus]|uniref:Uncharacterized protein n=1 Tax=Pangasianodon hypophthalmus TaxID=310915 RepID=A0A5N5PT78_PANHP|nr:uncharacterized protein LOC113542112 [Pangasianodon hypophthalmus]KAB5582186.1 hypothetical protein PHYPO_G00184270 [Pangasianodon hypophthalmus]
MAMSVSPSSGSKDLGYRSASLLSKTSSFSIMSEIKNFTVSCLDLDTFLSAKVKLRQEGFLDSNMKTSLDFAIQTLENFPVSKRRDVSLTLEGERQLVRFTSGNPVLLYVVRLGQKGPELHQKVPVGSRLNPSCLSESHFFGHCCRDELESCMDQARRVLSAEIEANPSSQSELELRIVCGEFRITYTTQQPQRSLFVRPHRRLYFGKTLNLEKLLETKTRLERSGEMKEGLLACFQHLLINYSQFQEENIRVVIQSDGELMELVCGRKDYHSTQHFLFTDGQNRAHSHRVQDMELWEYE